MPIYEYECCDCEHSFEIKQGFHDEPLAECPKCRGRAQRVIRSVLVIFKGSGFYVTDSRSTTDPYIPKKGKPGRSKSKAQAKSQPKAKKDKPQRKDS